MPCSTCTTGIAHAQLREVADHRLDAGGALALLAAQPPRAGGVELGFGDDGQPALGQDESFVQRRYAEGEPLIRRHEGGEVRVVAVTQAVLGEHLPDRFASPGRVGGDQQAAAETQRVLAQLLHGIVGTAFDGQHRQRLEVFVGAFAQRDPAERLGAREELLRVQEEVGRRQDRARGVAREEAVPFAGLVPEALDGGLDRAVHDDHRIRGQVVEQRGGLVEEQRQEVLDALRRDAVADVLVDGRAARIAFDPVAPAAAERLPRRFVDRELAARQQADVRHRIQAALRVRIERADRLELVVEQVEPVGQRRTHREQIEQSAADRELARRDDLRNVLVAGEHELGAQRVDVDLLALAEEEGVAGDVLRRRDPVQRRRRGNDEHVHPARGRLAQPVQRLQPLRDEILVRRQRVVGQRLPVRQRADGQRGVEVADLLDETLRVQRVGGEHDQQRAARPCGGCRLGEQQGVAGARRPRDGDTGPCGRKCLRGGARQRGPGRGGGNFVLHK